jgi:ADP-ribose pyrophosphatase YjhB (NUDIX family)
MQKRYFASAFVRNDTSIVMVKHQGESDPQPYWGLPGGRVEIGETSEQAVISEVKEETGLTVHTLASCLYGCNPSQRRK